MKEKKTKFIWGLIFIGVPISVPFVFLTDKVQERKKMKFYASRV